jgi:hypothetical protein
MGYAPSFSTFTKIYHLTKERFYFIEHQVSLPLCLILQFSGASFVPIFIVAMFFKNSSEIPRHITIKKLNLKYDSGYLNYYLLNTK